MAKNTYTNIKETITKEGNLFLAKTDIPNTVCVIFAYSVTNYVYALAETKAVDPILYIRKDYKKFELDIKSLLNLSGFTATFLVKDVEEYEDFSITEDYNELLKDLGYKSMSKKHLDKIAKALDIKFDSSYSYTTISTSNKNNLKRSSFQFTIDTNPNKEVLIKHVIDPDKEEPFIIGEEEKLIYELIKSGNNLYLIGEPGAGKTYSVTQLCRKNRNPLILISCNEGTLTSTFTGEFQPNDKPTTISFSKLGSFFKYVYTIYLKLASSLIKDEDFESKEELELARSNFAFLYSSYAVGCKYGAVILLDEINRMPQDVQACLLSQFDETKKLQLPNGEVIDIHPDTRFVATGNPGASGTRDLISALVNRMYVHTVESPLDKSNRNYLIQRLAINTSLENTKAIETLADAAIDIHAVYESDGLEYNISTRNLTDNYLRNILDKDGNLLHTKSIRQRIFNSAFVDAITTSSNDSSFRKAYIDRFKPHFDALEDALNTSNEDSIGTYDSPVIMNELDLDSECDELLKDIEEVKKGL
jgi:MoxR-like ATPase